MEDDDGFVMQAMLPPYEKMRTIRGEQKSKSSLCTFAKMTEQGTHIHVQRVTLLRDTMKRGEPSARFVLRPKL